MMPYPADPQHRARHLLQQYEHAFEHGAIPAFAWEAWRITRLLGLQPPDWVLTYFDTCAGCINHLIHNPPEDPGTATAVALGFKSGTGKKEASAFSVARNLQQEEVLRNCVRELVEAGHQETYAIDAVAGIVNGPANSAFARALGKPASVSTVGRAYKKTSKFQKPPGK